MYCILIPFITRVKNLISPVPHNSALILCSALALLLTLFSEPVLSQDTSQNSEPLPNSDFDDGPDGDPFAEIDRIRDEAKDSTHKDSVLSSDYDPLHKLWDPVAENMREKGVEVTFQYIFMVQNSDDKVQKGDNNTLSGGDADLAIKWNAYKPGEALAGYVRLSGEYRHGYGTPPSSTASEIGSLWPTVRGWNEYSGVALTEAYWHQGTLANPFEYRIGRVKNTTIWNIGKYIGGNDGFVGGQITGTPALITLSSAWSINGAYHPVGGNTHIMGGIFQADVDNQDFNTLKSDELIYAMQMGWKPYFSVGKGRYSIFSWHVDETDKTSDANGFAVNLEQNISNWTPFIRYSFGDQKRSDRKSHPIRQSANIGVGYNNIFGRSMDWLAIVATWVEPTDKELRDQYALELDYKFRLTPHSFLTPHIQMIRDPSRNRDKDNVLVLGLRAKIEF